MKIRLWRFWILQGGREAIKITCSGGSGRARSTNVLDALGRSQLDEKAILDVLGTRWISESIALES